MEHLPEVECIGNDYKVRTHDGNALLCPICNRRLNGEGGKCWWEVKLNKLVFIDHCDYCNVWWLAL